MPAQLISMGIDIAENDASSQLSQRRLEGKVAIITGGARGIGEATVRLFVMHGAKVVIADIADDAGIALANSLAPSAAYVHCNVTSEEDIKTLIDKTISLFGKLDVFLNNAGVLGDQSKRKSIMDFDSQEFDRVMQVNVKGTALGMKHAAKVMVPRRSGCIISTASVAGFMGGLGPHAYTASKHAIIGLTRNTACELGQYGIRVNCLSPFGVATSMLINAWRSCGVDDEPMNERCCRAELERSIFYDHTEAEKMEEFVRGLANLKGVTLKASDIGEAALYLASEESKYVSGHNLVVDGGFTSSINCVGF